MKNFIKKSKYFLLAAVLVSGLIAACKKDNSERNKPTPLPNQAIVDKLKGKSFKLNTINDPNNASLIPSADFPVCILDDILIFNTSGTVTIDYGVKCNAQTVSPYEVSPVVKANPDSLVIPGLDETVRSPRFKINALTADQLIIQQTLASGKIAIRTYNKL